MHTAKNLKHAFGSGSPYDLLEVVCSGLPLLDTIWDYRYEYSK